MSYNKWHLKQKTTYNNKAARYTITQYFVFPQVHSCSQHLLKTRKEKFYCKTH